MRRLSTAPVMGGKQFTPMNRKSRDLNRKTYVRLFMVLAVLFVPVLINFGVIVFIVPTVWAIASTVVELFEGNFRLVLGYGVYSAIFVGVFYGLARLSFLLISLLPSPRLRLALQCALLAALFACSFLHVLTYGSLQGGGGTYTFWSAAKRQVAKHWDG